jgi:hypothetical protein
MPFELGASKAPVVVNGPSSLLVQHWMVDTGQQPPEDFWDNFQVHWGKHNEGFCLNELEYYWHWIITERQRRVQHPKHAGIHATLDGYREWDDAAIEQKVLSVHARAETVGLELGFVPYYAPQVAVQVACRQCTRGWLSVQQGNNAPILYEINLTPEYVDAVIERMLHYQRCVDDKTPPGPLPRVPVLPDKWRTVDLNAGPLGPDDNWGPAMKPALRLWSDTRETAEMHEQAKKDVKLLLPDDVGEVRFGAFSVKRSRNGAVSIRELASA